MTQTLDWPTLRAVLAVAEEGSMTAAARVLGQSQPTVSRHISAAETTVGQYLFARDGNGLVPTEACERLLPEARDIRDSLHRVARTVAGEDPEMAGPVRLTAPAFVAAHFLPHILAGMRKTAPDITLDVATRDTPENPLPHGTDIALLMAEPLLLDTVTEHLGDVPLGLYGARIYAEAHGLPATLDALRDHALVGDARRDTLMRALREKGVPVTRRWFQTSTDDPVAHWRFVKAGCGIGVAPCVVAERAAEVVAVLPEVDLPPLSLWLAAPRTVRHRPRVAAVWKALAEGVAGVCE